MPMKIFLGDLIHDWGKKPQRMFPLNIGYLAAYASSIFGSEVEIRLFKSPQNMLEAINQEKPHIVGLSYYVWNINLNRFITGEVKRISQNTLTIGGGPLFTPLNSSAKKANIFFEKQSNLDIYCLNQGEVPFANVISEFENSKGNVKRFRENVIPGAMHNTLHSEFSFSLDAPIDSIKDLNCIPSPYLSGTLDPFFEEAFVPLLETNRSCPYRCTFCSWGIGTQKFAQFSDDRVMEEIDYICSKVHKTSNL